MPINSLKDILKSFGQSLQISTIFPASLFVLTNVYFVLPKFWDFDSDAPSTIFVITSTSLMLSYMLYAFNFPLIRVLEGYRFRPHWPFSSLEAIHKRNYRWYQKSIEDQLLIQATIREELGLTSDETPFTAGFHTISEYKPYIDKWIAAEYMLGYFKGEFDMKYPHGEVAVLPTALGNTIAAFEDYPRNRYGIESIALWPRFVPVLRQRDFLPFIVEEKTVFDFLLNIFFVVGIVGAELFYIELFLQNVPRAIFWLACVFVSIPILYSGLIVAAEQWGLMVRVAFDLYRHDLHKALRLVPQPTFEDEFRQWQRISSFLMYRRNNISARES